MAEELLGSDLAGIYLFGSAVAGGLRVDSDVDVLAITNRRLSEAVRKILVTRLMEISGKVGNADSVKPLEFTVTNLADVVPCRVPDDWTIFFAGVVVLERVQFLLGRVYKVSWVLVP